MIFIILDYAPHDLELLNLIFIIKVSHSKIKLKYKICMSFNEKTLYDFENVTKFRKEVINPIFPNADFKSSFMVSSPDEPATSFKGELSTNNLFKETDYEYKGDGRFLHYTSLFGIKAILETGFLRMSEFGNLIDKKELQYGARVFEDNSIFQFDKDELEKLKNNLFCLSACESNEFTKRDGFMWEVYADKGKGVLLEFELTKKNPKKFLLGKVQYGDNSLQPLKIIKAHAEQFVKDNEGFFPNNFLQLFMEIQSFHKAERYKVEQEVRLFLKVEKEAHENHTLESIYKDINSNQEVKYFNQLYLKGRHPYLNFKYPFSDEEDEVFNEFPQIEIKNIILGYNISVENKVDLAYFLCNLKKEHKYDFKISQICDEGIIKEMYPPCNLPD